MPNHRRLLEINSHFYLITDNKEEGCKNISHVEKDKEGSNKITTTSLMARLYPTKIPKQYVLNVLRTKGDVFYLVQLPDKPMLVIENCNEGGVEEESCKFLDDLLFNTSIKQ